MTVKTYAIQMKFIIFKELIIIIFLQEARILQGTNTTKSERIWTSWNIRLYWISIILFIKRVFTAFSHLSEKKECVE